MVFARAERGEKELRTDWPNEEGITDLETQTQIGRISNLIFQEGSNVLSRNRVLI